MVQRGSGRFRQVWRVPTPWHGTSRPEDYRGPAARSIVLALTLPAPSRRIRTAAGPSGTPVLPQRRALTG